MDYELAPKSCGYGGGGCSDKNNSSYLSGSFSGYSNVPSFGDMNGFHGEYSKKEEKFCF